MPQAVISVKGDIKDFAQVDNLYNSLKRETKKLLRGWSLEVDVKFVEREGEEEIP